MKLKIFLLFIFLPALSSAQKETSYWFFGNRAGINFKDDGSIAVSSNGKLQTVEGSATISDHEGNLLFYTDGITVYNKNHAIMPNGTGLKGNYSSTQSAIIVPMPGSSSKYYLFTVDKPDYFRVPDDPIEGVNYSVVDMSLYAGLGGVVDGQKNIHLVTYNPNDPVESEYKSSEKISAIVSGECNSYWVLTQMTNKFYAFKITTAGVNPNPVISTLSNSFGPVFNADGVNVTAKGYLKISPNGKRVAAAYSSTPRNNANGESKNSGEVYLYDFDDITGKVSNEQLLLEQSYPYGVEFSANSEVLYVTANIYNSSNVFTHSALYQYDLNAGNIRNSQLQIKGSQNVAGALQLGPNNKIYRAGYPVFSTTFHKMSVIKNPEIIGAGCDYFENTIDISPGEIEIGLPPFVQSYFAQDFNYENLCVGSETHFFVTDDKKDDFDSVLWDFGDGNTSTDLDAYHIYAEPGTYQVQFQAFVDGDALDPTCQEITIIGAPSAEEYILQQCDTDSNTTDGISEFNLSLAKDALSLDNSSLEIYFYNTKEEAEEDNNNLLSLDNLYTNQTPEEIVYAKITSFNSSCYGITKIKLIASATQSLMASPISGCDLGDGTAEFNLTNLETSIIQELNLPEDTRLKFYKNEADANVGKNPLPGTYISTPQTIYIRASSETSCYGIGAIALKIKEFPEVAGKILEVCNSDFPIKIGPDNVVGNSYEYLWDSGETSRNIQISSEGIYELQIIDPELGCGRSIQYEVKSLITPEITDIEIENHGGENTVTLIVSPTDNTQNWEYSIDRKNGPYQTSPIFTNIPGGSHTFYATSDAACGMGEMTVSLFGFPSYFTPNQDSYNDLWKPYDTDDPDHVIIGINIFDRYGKLIKHLLPYEKGWDGTFNGHPMPSDDYWFEVFFKNGDSYKSHFSLLR